MNVTLQCWGLQSETLQQLVCVTPLSSQSDLVRKFFFAGNWLRTSGSPAAQSSLDLCLSILNLFGESVSLPLCGQGDHAASWLRGLTDCAVHFVVLDSVLSIPLHPPSLWWPIECVASLELVNYWCNILFPRMATLALVTTPITVIPSFQLRITFVKSFSIFSPKQCPSWLC